jgi:hypothetical protein
VNGAQIWTVIGSFATGMTALIVIALRRIGSLESRLGAKLDTLERDIAALSKWLP